MDEVHKTMPLRHYSIHTERSYSDWIKRFVRFHGMNSWKKMEQPFSPLILPYSMAHANGYSAILAGPPRHD